MEGGGGRGGTEDGKEMGKREGGGKGWEAVDFISFNFLDSERFFCERHRRCESW